MSIKSVKEFKPRFEIDLTGPDGNAYILIAKARDFAKMLDLDSDKIIAEMTSSNYENLIQVFDRYFGSLVALYR